MTYPKNDFRYYKDEEYLEHYGVKGMKWGKHTKKPGRISIWHPFNKKRRKIQIIDPITDTQKKMEPYIRVKNTMRKKSYNQQMRFAKDPFYSISKNTKIKKAIIDKARKKWEDIKSKPVREYQQKLKLDNDKTKKRIKRTFETVKRIKAQQKKNKEKWRKNEWFRNNYKAVEVKPGIKKYVSKFPKKRRKRSK